jgi:four helix bundle protein
MSDVFNKSDIKKSNILSILSETTVMDRKILQARTKQFHIDVIKLCEDLPRNAAGFETAKQVIRSAGSVGANYRATVRAKSKADFIYKIEIVLEEADESMYWLEVMRDSKLKMGDEIERLIKEANELTAIFAATDKTAKEKK